jgi:hypothetical protein
MGKVQREQLPLLILVHWTKGTFSLPHKVPVRKPLKKTGVLKRAKHVLLVNIKVILVYDNF